MDGSSSRSLPKPVGYESRARRKPQESAGDVQIVGNDDEPAGIPPVPAASSHDTRASYTVPQEVPQRFYPGPPTSNTSMVPNAGDDSSSIHAQKRPSSEGGVTSDLKDFTFQDPQSPSSAVARSPGPYAHLPKKRPSATTLPGDARPSKLHSRAGSGSDHFAARIPGPVVRGSRHSDSPRDMSSTSPSKLRHSASRMTNPSPLGQFNEFGNIPEPLPSSGNFGDLDSLDLDLSPSFDPPQEPSPPPPPLFKQPKTRPITHDQLVNEVRGIYTGLVTVEKKCIEVDSQQAASPKALTGDQYQALMSLHRTLLHEHHDFFLASQHPSAGAALKGLALKYAMPARMWRHGIHSFLELLRHRLPESLEHMLAFVCLAYSNMALLMESVPSFQETWIECLGDLARYRMAIEESDPKDRETWSGVARMWYNRAADRSPGVGRIQHHLAVLARPNIVQQLFYYSKALISIVAFPNARESIMLLFNPFLEDNETASQRYLAVDALFVKAHGTLFAMRSVSTFDYLAISFVSCLDEHIAKSASNFRLQGPEMAAALIAAIFDYGRPQSYFLTLSLKQHSSKKSRRAGSQPSDEGLTPSRDDQMKILAKVRAYWKNRDPGSLDRSRFSSTLAADSSAVTTLEFATPDQVTGRALSLTYKTMDVILSRIGDKNVLPFAHVMLAFLWSLSFIPTSLEYVEAHVPWGKLALFLNTLGRHGAVSSPALDLPYVVPGAGRQLPEDFVMRGMIWAENYFAPTFFSEPLVSEDERALTPPSHTVYRAERCLWLGIQLSQLNQWLSYNLETKQFAITPYAQSLNPFGPGELDDRSSTASPVA